MDISLIVAMAENGVIGRGNALPWRLPADLRRFKALTMGKPLIMGRKTFQSIGRPLPGRANIVLTRDSGFRASGVMIAHDVAAAEALAKSAAETSGATEIMVIGGAAIYRLFLPRARRLYLTEVHASFPGDAKFPAIDADTWMETSRERHDAGPGETCGYSFVVLERRDPARHETAPAYAGFQREGGTVFSLLRRGDAEEGKMIKTIVVPTDGSDHATKAVDLAADIASKYDARLIVLHVLLSDATATQLRALTKGLDLTREATDELERLEDFPTQADALSDPYVPVIVPVPVKLLQQVGQAITERAKTRAEAKGVKIVVVQIVGGRPADGIIEASQRENADMIVMGSRGFSDIKGLFLGSVSHRVSHLADCTCVTVK